MKLRYIKQINGWTVSYGQPVKTGTIVDSAAWGDGEISIIAKALASGNWEEVREAIQVTNEGVVVEKPKAKKRK